ncbi:hypothetical protein Y1Q_0018719 [Alligator mississippiensis]|uniref:Uncharacterized protein n=1 Tax=Alligator mississippiensis TaxID=8496 RepID=A0A151NSI9_ALLMI|nr:hypothetical protein Y1Q_0018719 [Alligator mississippiensis]
MGRVGEIPVKCTRPFLVTAFQGSKRIRKLRCDVVGKSMEAFGPKGSLGKKPLCPGSAVGKTPRQSLQGERMEKEKRCSKASRVWSDPFTGVVQRT